MTTGKIPSKQLRILSIMVSDTNNYLSLSGKTKRFERMYYDAVPCFNLVFWCFNLTLLIEDSTRLGRPIAKDSELGMCFGGGALEVGLKTEG